MPATVVSKDGRSQYTVDLTAPLMPGEWLTYTRITKSTSLAAKQDETTWTYKFDESYGYEENDFAVTVLLPEGAESFSLQTEGDMEHALRQGRRVFVTGRRSGNGPFRFTVDYRMPDEGKAESKNKPDAGGTDSEANSGSEGGRGDQAAKTQYAPTQFASSFWVTTAGPPLFPPGWTLPATSYYTCMFTVLALVEQ